jgi:hypothetical protein
MVLSRFRVFAVSLLVCASAVSPAPAQRPEIRPRLTPFSAAWHAVAPTSHGLAPSALAAPADTTTIRPTHWLKGGVIGGLVLGGTLGTLVFLASPYIDNCDSGCRGSYTVSAAALGGFAGFIAGALIGGAFPKGGGR